MKVGTLNDPLLLGTNNLEFYNDMIKMQEEHHAENIKHQIAIYMKQKERSDQLIANRPSKDDEVTKEFIKGAVTIAVTAITT